MLFSTAAWLSARPSPSDRETTPERESFVRGGSIRRAVAVFAVTAALTSACGSPQTRTFTAPSTARCELQLDRDNASFPPAGGSGALQVTVNRECQWTARAEAPWVSLTGGEGHGAGSIQFTVAANAAPASRSATVLVNDRRLVIVQEGRPCEFSVSSERETVQASGGRLTIRVGASASECAWTAAANEPWLTIASGREGRGEGLVTVTVAATDGPSRTGTLTIAGQTVRVVQTTSSAPGPGPPSACAVSFAPAAITESAGGGTTAINVDAASDCSWAAVAEHSWIALPGSASGVGRGQVRVTVAANAGPARTGAVALAGQRIAVSQASGCTYAITPAAQPSPARGGSAVVSVATGDGCAWTAGSAVDWIAATAPAGSGPGPVTLAVAPNPGPPRRGAVTVAGHTHTVDQGSSCTWSFNPPFHDLDAGGGFGSVLVFVSGACTWTATTTVDWIRVVSGASSSGNGLVQFTAAPNTGRARTGAVTIGGERYVVNQAGQ